MQLPREIDDFASVVFLANLDKEFVDSRVPVIDDVELFGIALGGVPDLVLIVVRSESPSEHHGVEASLVDEVLQKDGPFIELDLHFDAKLLEVVLNQRGDVTSDFISVVGDESKSEALAVLLEDAIFARLPARLGEKLAGLFRVVGEWFDASDQRTTSSA